MGNIQYIETHGDLFLLQERALDVIGALVHSKRQCNLVRKDRRIFVSAANYSSMKPSSIVASVTSDASSASSARVVDPYNIYFRHCD